MSTPKVIALGLLAGFAAMTAATWRYGVTGGALVARVGSFGLLVILAATVVAMLVVVLWRPRKPGVTARAPGWKPETSDEAFEIERRREAAYEARLRRSAEDQAAAPPTGKPSP
jgi:uncharacterized membrane protein